MVVISVALCTFNGAKYIGKQLESILGQTLQPDEIVISDDGSTDGTVEIARAVFDAAGIRHINLRVLETTTNRGVLSLIHI